MSSMTMDSQWLKSINNMWPCRLAISLDINKQVERLIAIRIKHSVGSWPGQKAGIRRILSLQDTQNWLNVERVKGTSCRQS